MHRESAISTVMAAIMLLAIVFVLAAVAFAFARDVGQTESATPAMSFQRNEVQDSIRVPRATPGIDWSEFQIRTTSVVPGLVVDINDAAGAGDQPVGTSLVAMGTGTITGGDRLNFCATAKTSDVRILIVHLDTNENVYDATFLDIRAC